MINNLNVRKGDFIVNLLNSNYKWEVVNPNVKVLDKEYVFVKVMGNGYETLIPRKLVKQHHVHFNIKPVSKEYEEECNKQVEGY